MSVYLGIDYGTKRIGLAVSDAGASIAAAVRTIQATGQIDRDARAILAAEIGRASCRERV